MGTIKESAVKFEPNRMKNVADLEVVSYGFPLFWLFHQITSIAGPVDVWSVEWTILIVNFVSWWIISIAIVFAWRKIRA